VSLSGYEYRALLDTPGLTAQLDDRGHRAPLDIQGRGQHMELLPGRRQPGAGYEALHPELEGINPEDYPDIHKMAILADVAPYSTQSVTSGRRAIRFRRSARRPSVNAFRISWPRRSSRRLSRNFPSGQG